MRDEDFSATLLAWYDRHARVLPWRVGPTETRKGQQADPYLVWLSEIMLQQTTVVAVQAYFLRFMDRWPDVAALAAAADAEVMGEWAGLGYYARARNLLACARVVVRDHGGRFPRTRDGLLSLPGVGPYTAAAIAAIAFDQSATVVDGNVERVLSRLFAVETPLPSAKPELTALAARLTPERRPGDHAQAMMDLGATICTPRKPDCSRCPLRLPCRARIKGLAAHLPLKTPKPAKPVRYGIAYVARRSDGALLVEDRPARGLLGGMLGWPGTEWTDSMPPPLPPVAATWQAAHAGVRHTFTHFHLHLSVRTARLPAGSMPERGRFISRDDFRASDLPTVMRKILDVAQPGLERD